MRTRKISVLVLLGGLVGVVALMSSPAGAQTGLTSGQAVADDDSVASGTAHAVDGSTASGDATAIDQSTASGCSTAIDDSTASGGSTAIDDSTTSGGVCPTPVAAPAPVPAVPVPTTVAVSPTTTAAPAPTPSPNLARTGSDAMSLIGVGFGTLLAGSLLVGVAATRRRPAGLISIADIFPRFDDTLAAELTAAFGPGLLYRRGPQTD